MSRKGGKTRRGGGFSKRKGAGAWKREGDVSKRSNKGGKLKGRKGF